MNPLRELLNLFGLLLAAVYIVIAMALVLGAL